MYSFYNVVLVLASRAMPVHEVVQANAWIVVFGVLVAHVYVGPHEVWGAYAEYIGRHAQAYNYVLIDLVFHALPAFIVGAPKQGIPLVLAYACMLVWYNIVREQMQSIYMTNVSKKQYDIMVYVGIPMCILLYYVVYLI